MSAPYLTSVHEGIQALHDPAGLHVGNFKWINGQWKFKAIGYDPRGQVLPGGGPLTDRHNLTVAQLDEATVRGLFFQE